MFLEALKELLGMEQYTKTDMRKVQRQLEKNLMRAVCYRAQHDNYKGP